MQSQDTQKSNVVSLFAARQKDKDEAPATESATKDSGGEFFEDIMARNSKNAERMAKERANANKSVLRSYRIKH